MSAESAPPSRFLSLMELPRAFGEFAMLPFSAPVLTLAPRGDGHPVLVLPGFVASDHATLMLRAYLTSLGHDAHGWQLGRNLGWRSIGRDSAKLAARLDALHRTRGQTVSLVGWSLGGMMARHLAKLMPDKVRRVVTLGSPIAGDPGATVISGLYERISGDALDDPFMREFLAETRKPPPVPSTAIYSDSDGIVSGSHCREIGGERTESIAVFGSHVGLTVNPAALYAVADRLAQRDGAHHPFEPGWLAPFYAVC